MDAYEKWIADYHALIGGPQNTLGRCRGAAESMKGAFPELEIKRGHVHCRHPWGKRGHWWLVTPDGAIVDPTAGQFGGAIVEYEEYVEGTEVRLGACMNCGADIWGLPEKGRQSICSKECHRAFVAYLEEEAS